MSPTPLTTRPRPRLLTAATISFSLTFVAVSLAILFGYIPPRDLLGAGDLDTGVVLLMVPLAALVLVTAIEAVRTARAGRLHAALSARRTPLSEWQPQR